MADVSADDSPFPPKIPDKDRCPECNKDITGRARLDVKVEVTDGAGKLAADSLIVHHTCMSCAIYRVTQRIRRAFEPHTGA